MIFAGFTFFIKVVLNYNLKLKTMKTISLKIAFMLLAVLLLNSANVEAQNKKAKKTIDKINKICKEYDMYKRVFTITENNSVTLKSESCVVVLPVKKIVDVTKAPSGKNFAVQFKAAKDDKCISVDCTSFDEMTDLTSITITDEKAADELIGLFNKLFKQLR